ncbi:hypothetical protein A8A01_03030 [Ewingella americana]|nr:hypothetical protein A8A01_03030 [Ewingella americana]
MGYRDLLKEATRLKKEKKYEDACNALRLAFSSASENEYIDIRERLRLPAYLCFDDKDDEAWWELNKLLEAHTDMISQFAIISKMSVFLEDEGKILDSLMFFTRSYILDLMHRVSLIVSMHESADKSAMEEPLKVEMKDGTIVELDFRKMDENKEPFAYTKLGNPIYAVAYNHTLKSLNDKLDFERIKSDFKPLCKKANRPDLPKKLAKKVLEILEYEPDGWLYDLNEFIKREFED